MERSLVRQLATILLAGRGDNFAAHCRVRGTQDKLSTLDRRYHPQDVYNGKEGKKGKNMLTNHRSIQLEV